MIHSLEDKTKRELLEICKIQMEEYQKLARCLEDSEEQIDYLQEELTTALGGMYD